MSCATAPATLPLPPITLSQHITCPILWAVDLPARKFSQHHLSFPPFTFPSPASSPNLIEAGNEPLLTPAARTRREDRQGLEEAQKGAKEPIEEGKPQSQHNQPTSRRSRSHRP